MLLSTWLAFTTTLKKINSSLRRILPKDKIFYDGPNPWRWKGVTAFGLMNRFAKGENIDPFLDAFEGFNVLRVFYYVDWPGTGWGIPTDDAVHRFLDYVGARGFHVELVLLTGLKGQHEAQDIVTHCFTEFGRHENLFIEEVNEPGVHDKVDPKILTEPLTPVVWTDGLTVAGHEGLYLTPHTPRDSEWARRAHDLLEYYSGGGPGSPSDPAFHEPAVADEPAKKEDVPAATWDVDFLFYFGACSLLGAGATFHFESGKYGHEPTEEELRLAKLALFALDAFPPDAPLGAYRRIDEKGNTSRTYVIGERYMVRGQPKTLTAPEPGWQSLEPLGVLWKK